MNRATIDQPADDEYLAHHARYISLVPNGDIRSILARQNESAITLLRGLSESQGGYCYAPSK